MRFRAVEFRGAGFFWCRVVSSQCTSIPTSRAPGPPYQLHTRSYVSRYRYRGLRCTHIHTDHSASRGLPASLPPLAWRSPFRTLQQIIRSSRKCVGARVIGGIYYLQEQDQSSGENTTTTTIDKKNLHSYFFFSFPLPSFLSHLGCICTLPFPQALFFFFLPLIFSLERRKGDKVPVAEHVSLSQQRIPGIPAALPQQPVRSLAGPECIQPHRGIRRAPLPEHYRRRRR